MTAFSAIAFLATQASGAASVVVAESADSRAQAAAASVSAPVHSERGGRDSRVAQQVERSGTHGEVASSSLAAGVAVSNLEMPRSDTDSGANRSARPRACPSVLKALRFYTGRYRHWTELRGAAIHRMPARLTSCPRYLLAIRVRKAAAAHRAYERWFTALYEKWRCIHEHEGAWNSNTGNGYWGGLQMDWGFQHTYGPEFIRRYGLANRWPVYAQLIAAERAYHGFAGFGGRGYSPWGTRGMCGL